MQYLEMEMIVKYDVINVTMKSSYQGRQKVRIRGDTMNDRYVRQE